MAQDPDRFGDEREQDIALNTHALDMVVLPGGSVTNESEADIIRGVLDANGIPSLLSRENQFPNLGFEIRVPRGKVLEAEQIVREALAAGPEAAAAAEAETER
ncbi:MAG TPA: hypothetical protein VMS37_31170 [Verrucomicrobiae bacterium]|nr:hypothetical protein [Verrucomicrobiae bacterium]